jgi:hypothetical protein
MKKFTTYLTESTKTYNFKLTVAGECTKEMTEKLKQAAEKYEVIKMSAPKRLPVQRSSDFPTMGAVEISLIDLEVRYPVTPEQLYNLFREIHDEAHIKIRTAAQAADIVPVAEEDPEEYKPVLTSELENTDTTEFRTDSQVANLMKEFSSMAIKYDGPKEAKAKTTNDLPQGGKSAVGSTKAKLPDVKSAAR